MEEFILVDDNNLHNGTGVKFAVIKRTDTGFSIEEADEGFQSEDRLIQGLIDRFFRTSARNQVRRLVEG